MSAFEKRRWAETAFKRLWWQGYRGRVVLFEWPTLENPDFYLVKAIWDPRNFDNSEVRAWRSAPALADLFQALGPARLRVMAHSMGNVVASEALRLHTGTPIHTYIACQAALSAQYFDNTTAAREPCPEPWFGAINTPDIMGHFMTGDADSAEYFQGIHGAKANKLHNYYNPDDFALIKWQDNNIFKPDDHWDHGYGYSGSLDRYDPGPEGVFNPQADQFFKGNPPGRYSIRPSWNDKRYTIFSYIAESRSRALGTVSVGTTLEGKEFSGNWNLQPGTGYDGRRYSHSRQFRSNVVDENEFWKKAVGDFEFQHNTQNEGQTP